MITAIEDYFAKGCGRCPRFDTADCSALRWTQGLEALRAICREAGLTETVKWGHPCYIHAGRNVAIFGAFREDFRLSFFEAGLMTDPEGVLEKKGPNTQHADMIRFTRDQQVAEMAPVIRAYLAEAMSYAEKGLKAPKVVRELALPEELIAALDADPAMAEAFHALTPGRQKSYAIAVGGAKASETRMRRALKYRDKILAGKGALER